MIDTMTAQDALFMACELLPLLDGQDDTADREQPSDDLRDPFATPVKATRGKSR